MIKTRFIRLSLLSFFVFLSAKGMKAQCSADFSYTPLNCQFNRVNFTFTGTTGKPAFFWDFGDPGAGSANNDTVANPQHQYSNPGNYTITLIIADTGGCRDTISKNIRIVKKAYAAFTVAQTCAGIGTEFFSYSSKDTADRFLSLKWTYAGGGSDTGSSPVHTFSSPGNKAVTLSIITRYGCKDTVTIPIPIFDVLTTTISKDSACIGDLVNFSINPGTTPGVSYNWNFGDASNSSSQNASHQYNSSGIFTPIATAKYWNGFTCIVKHKPLKIHQQPDAGFTILDSIQCYNGNSVCVKLKKSGPSLSYFSLSFDDGFVDYTSAYTDSIVCHSYTDTSGGKYLLSLTIIDKNKCSASSTAQQRVTIYPKLQAGIQSVNTIGCFKTPFSATNISNQQPPKVTSFLWDFGDGATDATNWGSVSHVYQTNGTFNLRLIINNSDGCSDTFTSKGAVSNTSYVVDAAIDSVLSVCRSTNLFQFRQTPISGAVVYWDFGNKDTSFFFSADYHYPKVGIYYPKIYIDKNGCTRTVYLDTVIIFGPQAAIGNIINQYQCAVRDTVTLNNTSIYFRNRSLLFHWDLNDPFAPTCTTDTKNGVNTNNNCNFSVDSTNVRHMYSPGQERCYYPQLIVRDTVIGCSDTVRANLPLIKPNAQTGVRILSKVLCLGPEKYKEVELDLSRTQPGCTQQKYWVMWDSTCARTGIFDSGWKFNQQKHNYGYNICDSSGKVTLGIVIQNGLDTNNVACTDTAWYHDILDFGRVNPGFTSSYDPKKHYCKNSSFTFQITDTKQDSLSLIRWDWGDGTADTSKDYSPASHTFKNAGVYRVILYLELNGGCTANDTMFVNVGYSSTFAMTKKELCLGESVTAVKTVNYWKNFTQYWNDTLRRNAGLESLKWDLGDGKGYSTNYAQPTITYPAIGNYTIKLATTDSAGCKDTLIIPNAVRVFTIKTKFTTLRDTFTCAQLIPFKSNVTVYDSVNNFGHPDDRVAKYLWNFGPGMSKSILANPTKYLRAGTYTIELLAENTRKCRDSFYKTITILGPTAYYEFTGDSTGCQALKVSFKNKSDFATAYTWNFGDAANSSIFTTSDTGVSFTYPQYGSFYPKLTAQITITNNGIPITCRNTYPDTPNTYKPAYRRVTVFENPKPDFNYITNCNTYLTAFSNISVCLTDSMDRFHWDFGDGDTSNQKSPNHQFADTGRYNISLTAYSRLGCVGQITKRIVIAPYPVVKFKTTDVCLGKSIQFIDSTLAFNDQIAKWQWNFNDNTSSILRHPLKTYTYDSVFKVTLTVTNFAGCNSSGTKNVKVYSRPKTDFSFTNQCFTKAIPLNNTTTSKETPVTYFWTLGDGDTSSATSLSKTYAAKGNYNVKLRSRNWFGCEDSITKEVTSYPLPAAAFTASSHASCLVGNRFVFTNSSSIDTGSLTYNWSFGSYSFSTQKDPVQLYDTAGKFNVRLISTTVYNCRDTAYDTIRIHPNPVTRIYPVVPLAQCINPNIFIIRDSTTILSGRYTRFWDLGDNTTSTDSVIVHRYKDSGTYNLQLITLSDHNCPDTLRFRTRVHPKPRADFGINNMIQCINGNSFTFTNTSTGFYGSTTSRWFFGDGDSSQNLNSSHTYNTHDTFTVKLIATNNTLCSDTVSKIAVVYTKPATSFIVNDSIACELNNIFLFKNTSAIAYGSMTYTWEFGDGRTAGTFNSQHSYDTFGTYPVKLIAVSDHGCRDTATVPATVFPMPVPAFTVNDKSQCINSQNFIFTNGSTVGNGSFSSLWNLGEKDTAMTANAQKQFGSTGPFKVTLHIATDHNCVDSVSDRININPKPIPSFTINDSNQCINDQLFLFTNTSTIEKGSMTWSWKQGNGNSSANKDFTCTYPAYGKYNVTLTGFSDSGCVDSLIKPIEVYPKPLAGITANDTVQCVNENMFSYHAVTIIPYGSIGDYFWKLNGSYQKGSPDTFRNYSIPGNYTVGLIVRSVSGCSDTAGLGILVNPKPKALFSINDSAQCENDNLFRFTNKSTFVSGTLTHHWDFGNGTQDTSTSVNKIFTQHDTLTVSLITFTAAGCKDTFQSDIIVFPQPHPSFTVNDSTQCLNGNRFLFSNTSSITSGTMTYTWNSGDNYSAAQLDTGHCYAKEGSYQIKLKAVSSEGCVDSFKRTATVYPKPNPDFGINKFSQCLNDQLFSFTNRSSIAYGSMNYKWNTGDGFTADSISLKHRFPAYGLFKVQLRAISGEGCSDSIQRMIRVFAKPLMQLAINDTDQCINSQNMLFSTATAIPEGQLINYFWDFGDGSKATGTNAAHRYKASAFYTITHTAVSDSGCTDSVQRIVRIYPKPKAMFSINDSAQCLRDNYYIFNDQSFDSSGIKIYHWDINNSFTAFTSSVRYNFVDTGYQFIELIVTSNNGCMDTMHRKAFLKHMPDPAFAKLAAYYCRNTGSVNLAPATPGGTFYGKNVSSTFFDPQNLWNDTVKYIVTVNGCSDSSVQYTKVYPPPLVELGHDTQLCLYEYVDLSAQSWNATYRWSTTGNNDPVLRVMQAGIYAVTATNICGTDSDTIRVSYKDINCRLMMPTAFSPNNDEINEFYGPVTVNVPVIKMEIFNRWGEKIFECDQDSKGWDGTYQGERVPQDVYLWLVYYRYPTGDKWIELNEKGTFHLLR